VAGRRLRGRQASIARELAYRFDLRIYPLDAYGYDHLRRSAEPLLAADHDERWLRPTPEQLAQRFVRESARRLPFVFEDLERMRDGPLVVAEGPQLFPALVARRLASPGHGLWLVPTEAFQARSLGDRAAPSGTSDPALAARNRLGRDAILNRLNRDQAAELGLTVVEVDGVLDLAQTTEVVAERFGERLAAGPRARDGTERRRMRRAENAAVLANVTAWRADVGAERLPEPPRVAFAWSGWCSPARSTGSWWTGPAATPWRRRTGPGRRRPGDRAVEGAGPRSDWGAYSTSCRLVE
jgi:hypothetical protein